MTANKLLRAEAHARSVLDHAPFGFNGRMNIQFKRSLYIGMTENLADALAVCACLDAARGERVT